MILSPTNFFSVPLFQFSVRSISVQSSFILRGALAYIDMGFSEKKKKTKQKHRPHSMIFEAYQMTSFHDGGWW